MTDLPLIIASGIALLTAAATAVCVIRDRLPGWYLIGALAALELALLAACVIGVLQVLRTDLPVERGTVIAYLVAMLILAPASTLWALVEQSRFGTAVIILACLAVPAMAARVQQVWDAASV
ncbi:hypothetical protein [Kribbella sp. NPDC023855]|uniref:hypothetical protein n=1 Tax=Kribbella sp. NPDC023855 TaxID=3154698 RepID=UPI0033FE6C5A